MAAIDWISTIDTDFIAHWPAESKVESAQLIDLNPALLIVLVDMARISTVVYNGLRGQLTRVQISSLIQLAVTDLF